MQRIAHMYIEIHFAKSIIKVDPQQKKVDTFKKHQP